VHSGMRGVELIPEGEDHGAGVRWGSSRGETATTATGMMAVVDWGQLYLSRMPIMYVILFYGFSRPRTCCSWESDSAAHRAMLLAKRPSSADLRRLALGLCTGTRDSLKPTRAPEVIRGSMSRRVATGRGPLTGRTRVQPCIGRFGKLIPNRRA
jgi:hypothetical protein